MEASVAARTGWLALRGAMRSWGVHSREELSTWLRRQGFPGLALGNHISARAQEFVLTEGCSHDGRVTLLESSFVTLVLHTGRTQTVQNPTSVAERPRVVQRPRPPPVFSDSWASLDGVQVEELFTQRVPMLKSCPHFFRGKLRHCFGIALREQRRAKIEGDRVAETRAWKLFGLVPMMLFHRTKWSRTIGREDDIIEGRWLGLVEAITSLMREPQSRSTIQEDADSSRERRGLQAQSRVQQGQVSRARQALVEQHWHQKTTPHWRNCKGVDRRSC